MSELDPDAFNALEHDAWEAAADPYAGTFGSLTVQAIPPLLDALRVGPATRLLDVACGPGWLSAAALERGAQVIGVDASSAMLELAAAQAPAIEFRAGDAEHLPFASGQFDAVAMNFGLLHLGRPESAIAEAFRVVRSGGRFGFTVWAPPSKTRAFGIVLDAIANYGQTDVGLPIGPPFFRFADPAESRAALESAGFENVKTQAVPQTWRLPSPSSLFDAMYLGTARTRALLRGQTASALDAIRAAITDAARVYAQTSGVEIPMPALLATGTRP